MADALNNGIFVGRLTAEPNIGVTKNETKYANFTLARDRIGTSGDNKKTDFVRFSAFDRRAEIVEKYVHKGDMIGVNYTVHTDYAEVTEGVRQTTFNFVVNDVALGLGGRKTSDEASDDGTTNAKSNNANAEPSNDELPW